MKYCRKHAFSLVEMSIIILIIGVLITGITQSVGIIKKFRLATARNLTEKSPVNTLLGLELWLEPTMEKSFLELETEDGVNLSQWNDINNQKGVNYYALKAASNQVKYEDNAIGNIPSIYFNGTPNVDSYFTLSKTTSTTDYTNIKYDEKTKLTIFTVSKLNKISELYIPIFFSGWSDYDSARLAGWGYGLYWSFDYKVYKEGIFGTYLTGFNSTATDSPKISSMTFSASIITDCNGFLSGKGSLKFYVNGTLKNQSTDFTLCSPGKDTGVKFKIGGFYHDTNQTYLSWNGFISEIIIFNRVLSDEERISVENYLSQKYKITLN